MATQAELKNRQLPFIDPDTNNLIPDNLSSGIIFDGRSNVIPKPLPYKIDPDGYIDEPGGLQEKSPLQPTNLIFSENNKISNAVPSWYNAVTDFKTFGCYIHHDIPAGLPQNLHTYNEFALFQFFQSRPMISNGSINVFPKLVKNQFTVSNNVYERKFRNYLP